MFRYRFECSDENLARSVMATMQSDSMPSLFGARLYDSGIHFTEFGKKIKGFYIEESEIRDASRGGRRGSPMRACFSGRFVHKKGKCFFEVSIYPRLFDVILLLVGYAATALVDWTAFAVASAIFLIFSFFYLKTLLRCAEEFDRLFR